jgi:hypothetical protein
MPDASKLAEENIACLKQMLSLLDRIDRDRYTRVAPPVFPSGIGSHLRHALDHYANFVAGLGLGSVDYENRRRGTGVETEPAQAREQILGIVRGLSQLTAGDEDRGLDIHVEDGGAGPDGVVVARSTVRRELDFLLSHTIHHYALIAVALRMDGFDPGEMFGVAPSTLRYLQGNRSCTA